MFFSSSFLVAPFFHHAIHNFPCWIMLLPIPRPYVISPPVSSKLTAVWMCSMLASGALRFLVILTPRRSPRGRRSVFLAWTHTPRRALYISRSFVGSSHLLAVFFSLASFFVPPFCLSTARLLHSHVIPVIERCGGTYSDYRRSRTATVCCREASWWSRERQAPIRGGGIFIWK